MHHVAQWGEQIAGGRLTGSLLSAAVATGWAVLHHAVRGEGGGQEGGVAQTNRVADDEAVLLAGGEAVQRARLAGWRARDGRLPAGRRLAGHDNFPAGPGLLAHVLGRTAAPERRAAVHRVGERAAAVARAGVRALGAGLGGRARLRCWARRGRRAVRKGRAAGVELGGGHGEMQHDRDAHRLAGEWTATEPEPGALRTSRRGGWCTSQPVNADASDILRGSTAGCARQ